MYKIPTILNPDEIIDKAFKRANKVQVVVKGRSQKHKKIAVAKVRKASNTISTTLNRYVKSFPSFDTLPRFYYDLFDVSLGIDAMKKSLGAVSWCGKTIQKIADEAVSNMHRLEGKKDVRNQVAGAYGRFSSVLNQISNDLAFLEKARRYLVRAPVIDVKKPTIVIAGAPNVGKSLIVKRISSAKPKIASYPFTTKGVSVGHFDFDGITYQVIDTPGLLDREMEKRNTMELKAILTLNHLANLIVFVIDPTEYCGYAMDSQLRILTDIKSRFEDIPIIEVENKADIMRSETSRIKISALNKEGIEELREILMQRLKERDT
ncbi:MAG: 50S ribosome-binding GTPase [Methanomassiliicoccales archaeon]|nr:MAG: 50S ribosome-binding GTPase [Methanomassiliicoccales archaeon]